MSDRPRNWAGNVEYSAARVHQPRSVAEVQEIVRRGRSLKVLGSRHSFNRIADTDGELITLDRLAPVLEIDRDRGTVTVDGGARYGELCAALAREGLALHNMASLPHISVAGACATATHGSGDRNANLASAVAGLELVAGDGEVVAISRDRDAERLRGAAVGLGALGVVTRLTLDVQPAYALRQDVYEGLALDRVIEELDAITGSGYSVSLFTRWRDDRVDQLWLKRRVDEASDAEDAADDAPAPRELFGATLATAPRHPIATMPADHCTAQLGARGPWHERLPHFRMEFTPSAGDELQTDYLVPRRRAADALRAVHALQERIAPLLQISEIRTVAADDLWMSPCRGEDCVSLHFTWAPDGVGVAALLPLLDAALASMDGRPHWGKLFDTPPARLRALYPRLPDFRRLVAELDPAGKFRNAFLELHLLGDA
jgi:alditol oxidase